MFSKRVYFSDLFTNLNRLLQHLKKKLRHYLVGVYRKNIMINISNTNIRIAANIIFYDDFDALSIHSLNKLY